MWALLVSSVLLAAPGDVVATTLDGQKTTGTVVELSGGKVVLKTAEGPVTIEPDEILSLVPQQPAKPQPLPYRVTLTDGSRLRVKSYTVSDGKAKLGFGNDTAEVRTRAVSIVRLMEETEVIKPLWAAILAARKTSRGDTIVIRKGEKIDPLEGVFHDVNAKQVQFELDLTKHDVSLDRVFAMIYFHAAAAKFRDPVCIVTDTDGSLLRLKSVKLAGGTLELETLAGLKTTRTWGQLTKLDFSAGKVMHLAVGDGLESDELGPLRMTYSRSALYQPRKNRCMNKPLSIKGNSYQRGLSLWSKTMLDYPLRKQYKRFHAVVGIDDWVRKERVYGAHAQLIITGDGKELYNAAVDVKDDPKAIDLDVSGVARLVIVVDIGKQSIETQDAVDLCEVRVTK